MFIGSINYNMAEFCKKFVDRLFWQGIEQGDILWFFDKVMKKVTRDCISFAICLIVIIFVSLELGCQLYLLTLRPNIGQILKFAPMFLISLHVLCCAVPIVMQRNSYIQCYKQYIRMWHLKSTDKQGLVEIRQLFEQGFYTILGYCLLIFVGACGYLPFNGLQIDNNIFPAIGLLKLFANGPKVLIYSIAIINYVIMVFKPIYMSLYGLHLMHSCILYIAQSILLRRRLRNICYDNFKVSPLLLIDNDAYQKWVQDELKECIKQDIKLKQFCNTLLEHFKWVLLAHAAISIILISLLYYLIIFMHGGSSPVGSFMLTIGGNTMAFTYVYFCEMFYEQVDLVRTAVFETPWYTFNTSNRKLIIIILSNLTKQQYPTAGGVFDVNYALLISIMHKVFNILTVLSKMTPPPEMVN